MKIGYFSSKFPYAKNQENYICGGSIFSTYYTVLEMAKRNHEIKVFTTSATSKNEFEKKNENLEIFRYGTTLNLLTSNISLGLFTKPQHFDVDIINVAFDIPPMPFAGLKYAKNKNVPLVLTYRGDWESNYGNLIRRVGVNIANKLADKIFDYASIIISPSKNYIKQSPYLAKYENKVKIIPNGLNFEEFQNSHSKEECKLKLHLPIDKKIILFFGYLYPHKSPEILIKILPVILKEMPDTLLVFAGNGVMLNELKNLASNLGVEKNVKFLGFITKEMRTFCYKASDVFILPSKKESFGNVAIEALVCEVPVIVTDGCGCVDIIKESNGGFITEYNNEKELIKKIVYLLEDSKKREKMAKNGKNYVLKNLNWEMFVKKEETIYNEILEV